MGKLEELEKSVSELPREELEKFRAWFIEFDHAVWDRKIEADDKAGRLDRVLNEAQAEYKAGKTRKI